MTSLELPLATGPRARPDAAHFAAPVCRNCAAPLQAAWCGSCGQARAKRLGVSVLRSEAWQKWRWFEWAMLDAAWRIASRPGSVAREYVLGARKRHVHPLKLLLAAIGVLLLVLARANYLESAQGNAGAAIELVRRWSNWSFSLGIFAILAASLGVFGRRGGYNATEHLVLAAYCQLVVIVASTLTKLPTLLWTDPTFVATHRALSPWLLNAIGALVIGVAFTQFFALDLRRDGGRLALALLIYLGTKWLLLRAYAWLIVLIVLGRPA